MATRRAIIAGGAGAFVLGALGWRAWNRGVFAGHDTAAYQPWKDWQGTAGEETRRPLHAAILAANPHDTQPWLFAPEGNSIIVIADRARHLGSFDPFRREMHLGLGCAIENLVHAARAFGFDAQVMSTDGALTLSPDDALIAAAHVTLTPATPFRDALFDAIPMRHTNRGPYRRDQQISPQILRGFADAIASPHVRLVFFDNSGAGNALGEMMVDATSQIIADPQMSADSARWFRMDPHEIAKHRDGVTLDTAGLSPMMVAASKMLPDVSTETADAYWLSNTKDIHVGTAPVLGIMLVQDRLDMAQAIEAGRAWQRLHLAATAAGLAAQPVNQPVEMIDRNQMLGRSDAFMPELVKLAQAPGWQPTFTFRMGVAERPAKPSPRRPLKDVVRA